MDNGQIFKNSFRVMPGRDGSFIVRLHGFDHGEIEVPFWAFSTIDDMIYWLTHNAEGFKSGGPQPENKS